MNQYSRAKQKLNIAAFNAMQEEAFKVIPLGNDVILLSLTGSGKTLAFLLPILEKLEIKKSETQILIITPTRELALQITNVASSLALGINITCCYGGHPIRFEKKDLNSNPHLVIGTPGRILDHLERENIDPLTVQHLVLDEFDKTLEMGFHKQMESIIKFLRYKPQYILTSATQALELPPFVPLLEPTVIDFIENRQLDGLTVRKIHSTEKDKLPLLQKLITEIGHNSTFIFVNFRESASRISEALDGQGILNDVFHGGLDQIERENVLSKFRNGSTRILVTTDLAGRGLDIPLVENIVHYHIPMDEATFIHRNGRTARMESTGDVYVITSDSDKDTDFVAKITEEFKVKGTENKIPPPEWVTIKISKGKRDKLRKVDVVGFLFKMGDLEKDDLGLVEVKESYSLAAVKRHQAKSLIEKVNRQKIKGKKALCTII